MTTRLGQIATQILPKMSDVHLYTAQTPNGIKVSILLEELGVPYKVTAIDISKNTQKEPWFLEINPNGRIPALTDTFTDGKPIRLFESGSIMQYLTDRYDPEHKLSYPKGSREYYEVNNWLMWQMGGLGPMQGQLNHFNRYAPEKIEYGINRYRGEVRRLYRTIETQLKSSTSGYLVGDRCTSADIACWGWIVSAKWAGIDMAEFPVLEEWVQRLLKRPGVEKGRHVPTAHTYETHQSLTPQAMDEKAAKLREWVQSSMKEEAK
ncbi:glutathione S-transferase [Hypoxylon trugodes]|uniref:glutathione S-transferase n=1 Tax=Hypoxylon trugodes TaxID=326681 RepID=UPI00219FEEAC|nr:glutathione S-transferase [Hypoxylon trugodes]KAI1390725.1 glutathione S-transferase [Hypoxylon trugodes]